MHASLSPAIEIGAQWPPMGITPLNPFAIPLLNTVLLLSSGALITYGHHALILGDRKGTILGLFLTIVFALIFTALQYFEYQEASFTIADSVFGSAFFCSTGLHGFHVIVGTLFITWGFFRMISYHFTRKHHVGLQFAILYWHFVDIVWLFLFVLVYYWTAGSATIDSVSSLPLDPLDPLDPLVNALFPVMVISKGHRSLNHREEIIILIYFYLLNVLKDTFYPIYANANANKPEVLKRYYAIKSISLFSFVLLIVYFLIFTTLMIILCLTYLEEESLSGVNILIGLPCIIKKIPNSVLKLYTKIKTDILPLSNVKPYSTILKTFRWALIIFSLIKIILFLCSGDTQYIKDSLFLFTSLMVSIEEGWPFFQYAGFLATDKYVPKVAGSQPQFKNSLLDSSISLAENSNKWKVEYWHYCKTPGEGRGLRIPDRYLPGTAVIISATPGATTKECQLIQTLYDSAFNPKKISKHGFKTVAVENSYDEQTCHLILNRVLRVYGDYNSPRFHLRQSLHSHLTKIFNKKF